MAAWVALVSSFFTDQIGTSLEPVATRLPFSLKGPFIEIQLPPPVISFLFWI